MRDVPWKNIFKLGASAAASEFCEWVQVGIDVCIPRRKFQVIPHSSPWFSAACADAIVHRNHFFCLYQNDKSSDSKGKFRQANNLIKQICLQNFSKNSNLDDSGISLPVFPLRTNLKMHNTSVSPKMIKKVIMNLDLPEASCPDCIPVAVLKNCELKLSYILAELSNKCLKESCFPDCWKVSSVDPVFKNVGERSTAKNYHPVSLLSVVSKVFEKLVNNRIVDHLKKCGLFSDFQISRSS